MAKRVAKGGRAPAVSVRRKKTRGVIAGINVKRRRFPRRRSSRVSRRSAWSGWKRTATRTFGAFPASTRPRLARSRPCNRAAAHSRIPHCPLRIPSAKRIGHSTTTPLCSCAGGCANPKQNFGKLQQVERPSAAHICDSTISLIAGRPGEPSQTEFGQDMIGVVPCGR